MKNLNNILRSEVGSIANFKTFEEFVNEGYNFKNFKVGDKVKINDDGYEELEGKVGVIVDIEGKSIYVDFGEVIGGDGFSTWDLDGRLDKETGLKFHDGGWIHYKFLDKRFNPRNFIKI